MKDINTPIDDFLKSYGEKDFLRLHMPAHDGLENKHDITEINGADSLYNTFETGGIIAQSEENARKLFGSKKTLYSCGGSTLSIQAMLGIALSQGGQKKLIATRYAHKSLINTAILLDLNIEWIYPEEYLSAEIKLEKINTAESMGVFVNNIDYYGGICRLKPLDVPLLVDNAHGSYLRFVDKTRLPSDMPKLFHPLEYENISLMSADSAHKTLPVLTGGGYLHISDERFIPRSKELMGVFGSSSPSYLILQSLDRCNRFLSEKSEEITEICIKIHRLKARLMEKGFILKTSDYLRITLNTAEIGYTGEEFSKILRENKIEPEMTDFFNVVLLLSCVISDEQLERIYEVISEIPIKKALSETVFPVLKPKKVIGIRDAFFSKQTALPLSEAVGKICGEIKSPCPPCVPLVMCGEEISQECAEVLRLYGVEKISVLV